MAEQACAIQKEWAEISRLKNQLPLIITEADADMEAVTHSLKKYLRSKAISESESELDFVLAAKLLNVLEEVFRQW